MKTYQINVKVYHSPPHSHTITEVEATAEGEASAIVQAIMYAAISEPDVHGVTALNCQELPRI